VGGGVTLAQGADGPARITLGFACWRHGANLDSGW
jgi:hypothetical protein